jgi:ATP-dependent RNA helicase RhlE
MKFSDLRLAQPLLDALAAEGYTTPTPVQAESIPPALLRRDLVACAQTGTGKTAAFALPILHRLFHQVEQQENRRSRCLVLCPTRELAAQIGESFRAYGQNLRAMRLALIFGGVSERPQIDALRRGADIIIATPGRLLDLMNQRHVNLSGIEALVLDEADRMLDMGFIHDIRRIVSKLPVRRQTMLFSATMPADIRKLAQTLMHDPVNVQVAPPTCAMAAMLDESVYFVERQNKAQLLAHLVSHLPMTRAIVFTRTKHGADRVVRHLDKSGIRAEAIHGNKSQNARNRALDAFRRNKIPVLVATDIASRGIDVDGITHVVNYDLTHEPETYIHRIGRTARAGASGAAVSFCDRDERANLQAIQQLTRRTIPVRNDHPRYAADRSVRTIHTPLIAANPATRPETRERRKISHPLYRGR